MLRVSKCHFQICRCRLENAALAASARARCARACRHYVFIEYTYHYTNKTKQFRPKGDGKPGTRCIAYLAPDANEDKWLLPVGAHIVRQGTERKGSIITQTHKCISW